LLALLGDASIVDVSGLRVNHVPRKCAYYGISNNIYATKLDLNLKGETVDMLHSEHSFV
jgi:hypothetical protein